MVFCYSGPKILRHNIVLVTESQKTTQNAKADTSVLSYQQHYEQKTSMFSPQNNYEFNNKLFGI